MASDEDVCVLDAPAVKSEKVPDLVEVDGQKVCYTCKVPVRIHVGKCGPGKCLGGAFTKAFRSLYELVEETHQDLAAERREAKDREVRLVHKLNVMRDEMGKSVIELESLKEKLEGAERHILNVEAKLHALEKAHKEFSVASTAPAQRAQQTAATPPQSGSAARDRKSVV